MIPRLEKKKQLKRAQKARDDLQGRSWGCTDLGAQPRMPSHPSTHSRVQRCTPEGALGLGGEDGRLSFQPLDRRRVS